MDDDLAWLDAMRVKPRTGPELEREHERKGLNIVSLSAARHRRDWNRHVATWSGGDDDHAA